MKAVPRPVEVAWVDGNLEVGTVPAGTETLEVTWLLHDGYGEQSWVEELPMSTVERLEVDVQRYSRAVPSDAVGLRARVTALDARGQKLGAALTASEVVVVDETGLRLPVERRLATADELARYAPPGFEGSMAYAGVPSRTDLAPDPIEPYDQSDREEDVPGAIVTEANDDLRVEGVSR